MEVDPFDLVDLGGVGYPVMDPKNAIEKHMLEFGAFEKPSLRLMADLTKRLPVDQRIFLDIGANIGQHTLFMAAHGAKQVFAFEPYQRVRERLIEAVELNGLTNVTPIAVGIGNRDEWLRFYEPPPENRGMGSFIPGFNDEQKSLELQVRQGDRALEEAGIDRCGLVKIDVEGMEGEVLRGLHDGLAKMQPFIMFELTRRPHTLREFFHPGKRPRDDELAKLAIDPIALRRLIHRVLPDSYTELFVLKRTAEGRRTGAYSLSAALPELLPGQIGDPHQDQHDLLAVPRGKAHLIRREGGGGDRTRLPLRVTHEWPLDAIVPRSDVRCCDPNGSLRLVSDFAVTGWSRAHPWIVGNDGPRQVGSDRTDHMVCGRPTGAWPRVNGKDFGSALFYFVGERWHRILDPRHVRGGARRH